DNARVPQLRRRPRLATEALQVVLGSQETGMRNLQGDNAAQLCVPGAPDRPEGPHADTLQELKLAHLAHAAGRGRLPRSAHPEGAAARRAEDLIRLLVGQFNGIVAMRTADAFRLGGG